MMALVGIGGSIGALFRFLVSKWIPRESNSSFPFATWIVNLSGSIILGVLAGLYISNQSPQWVWHMFGIGFCGAFTTFSTFSMEMMELLKAKRFKTVSIYLFSSILLGLIGAAIGLYI
ncbi:fluoride efflux transporter CrcB [Pseudalkalibacillus sp. R45]|uniref:fluoride efflux transporter CrcB n=1 Tax=Pseudalkalibacillus sp. R45 TaxID=3457433 RepID=UPI003FCEDAB5